MFDRLIRLIVFGKPNISPKKKNTSNPSGESLTQTQLSKVLAANIAMFKERFQGSVDIVFREFKIGFKQQNRAVLIFADGLVNGQVLQTAILQPLMFDLTEEQAKPGNLPEQNLLILIKEFALPNKNVQEITEAGKVIAGVLDGNTLLLIDGFNSALQIGTQGWESRAVEEPSTETVVRGPREGFTENISVNSALLRRKIKNCGLRIEGLNLGARTRTSVYLAYINGVVKENLVEEVKKRLQRIDIDAVLESGYIEQLIEDAPASIFPTIGNTEKPDIMAGKLLEGRVGIFVDGTPVALTIPRLMIESFQNAEDYYTRPYFATLTRWIRLTAFFISIFLPAVYVSLASFQQEMIPTSLLYSMAASREGVPFPAYMEVLVMGTIFEIMREAGVRMPRSLGQAVSIVGALVIGEAAVQAGLISTPMVIVVALTAISGFVTASLGDTLPILRIYFALWATLLGVFGTLMGAILVLVHLSKLRSFGVPYLAPLAPVNLADLKDTLVKAPFWALNTRPRVLGFTNSLRQKSAKPSPKRDNKDET